MSSLLGHTLGTPHLSLDDAAGLFARSGLDGIEVIWQDGYKSALPESAGPQEANHFLRTVRSAGLFVGCLTPYITDINSTDADVRGREIARYESAITTAARLDCHRIRVYGGKLLETEPSEEVAARWSRLVESLQHLGGIAQRDGIVLTVENHFNTMTVSAVDTARLVRDVGSPFVMALYDQANLTFTHQEMPAQAIALQAGLIGHVHVKDLEFIDASRPLRTGAVASIAAADRIHHSRMVGDGILNWPDILAQVLATGYNETFSLEYEYRWNPQDLPAPEVGFPESARRLRDMLASLQSPNNLATS